MRGNKGMGKEVGRVVKNEIERARKTKNRGVEHTHFIKRRIGDRKTEV